MSRVVLALGANVGDRLRYLQGAVNGLRPYVVGVSPVYETEPVGGVVQDDYLNAVVVAQDEVDAAGWLARARALEAAAGRVRGQRWGPRTLDVDVVAVDGIGSDDPELTLPHPRAHERAFVLAPWLDVEPAATLPGQGRIRELLAVLDPAGIRRRDDLLLR